MLHMPRHHIMLPHVNQRLSLITVIVITAYAYSHLCVRQSRSLTLAHDHNDHHDPQFHVPISLRTRTESPSLTEPLSWL
jgi:hypothetical protein